MGVHQFLGLSGTYIVKFLPFEQKEDKFPFCTVCQLFWATPIATSRWWYLSHHLPPYDICFKDIFLAYQIENYNKKLGPMHMYSTETCHTCMYSSSSLKWLNCFRFMLLKLPPTYIIVLVQVWQEKKAEICAENSLGFR